MADTTKALTLKEAALEYHRSPKPGKLEISATKTLTNQRDLALAYSQTRGLPAVVRLYERQYSGNNHGA